MKKIIVLVSVLLLVLVSLSHASDYTYTSLDYPGAVYNEFMGNNDSGQVVGNYSDGTKYHGFLYDGTTFTTINYPGATDTGATAISNDGHIVGAYYYGDLNTPHGFVYDGLSFTSINYPGALRTYVSGINSSGLIVGAYHDGTTWHGFTYNETVYSRIDIPGFVQTQLTAVNDSGKIVGMCYDSTGHGFVLTGNTPSFIDYPSASYTDAQDINNAGLIVGTYKFGTTEHSYVFDGVNFTSIDFPGATGTLLYGINNQGQLSGFYQNTTGTHGFIAVTKTATLVAQWEFDGNFTATNDSNYNGNPSGTVTFVPGQKGQAASFDGGTGIGSYDTAIDKVDSGKLTSASEFNGGLSIMGWIKPDTGGRNFLSHDQSCCSMEYMGFASAVLNDGSLQLFMRSNNDGRLSGISAPGAVGLGEWTHVAVTWDGNLSGGIQMYVNGLPVATTESFESNPFMGLNSTDLLPVRIGAAFADSSNNMYGFDGSIDHISLWKGALSAEAILDDYNNSQNTAPVANAGPDQFPNVGNTVTLDGSGSTDADDDLLTYAWELTSKPNGSNATLSNPTAVNPTFTVDKAGEYKVSLTVHDGEEPSAPDEVIINTVNVPPVADAGPDQLIIEIGTTVYLDGTQSYDPDGDDITYQWSFTSTPPGSNPILEDADTPTPYFVAGARGGYTIQLIVTDPLGENSTDPVYVSFDNLKPVADVGTGGSVVVGETVTLDGSGSSDANSDALTYQWAFTSVPAGSQCTIQDTAAMITTFVPDVAGTYEVQLVVNDGDLDSEPSSIQILVITEQTEAIETVWDCQEIIESLDPGVFKNANMQNTMINKLNAVIANIEAGNYEDALGQLQNDILKKTDGCATSGEPDKNDWIIDTDCEAQMLVYQSIQDAIVAVEALMQ